MCGANTQDVIRTFLDIVGNGFYATRSGHATRPIPFVLTLKAIRTGGKSERVLLSEEPG